MLRIYDESQHLTTVLWDSVTEPEALLKADGWNHEANKSSGLNHFTRKAETSWLGVPSVDALRKVLTKGWKAGVERIEKIPLGELPEPTSIRRRRVRADQGDELDMQAVYRGDMSRAWSKTKRQSRTSVRSVSIVIDLAGNAGVSSEQLFWRGASGLRLADELTKAGYSVAIYGAAGAANVSNEGHEDLVQFVEIKAEDSPLDMDRLAALTGLAGFFRTSLFAGIYWSCDQLGKHAAGGLGQSDNTLIAKAIKQMPIPQNSIIQPPVKTQERAEEWLKSVLEQIANPEQQAA
jgi:hypothetical protein